MALCGVSDRGANKSSCEPFDIKTSLALFASTIPFQNFSGLEMLKTHIFTGSFCCFSIVVLATSC
jgi:hypothetical protein